MSRYTMQSHEDHHTIHDAQRDKVIASSSSEKHCYEILTELQDGYEQTRNITIKVAEALHESHQYWDISTIIQDNDENRGTIISQKYYDNLPNSFR